MRIKVVVKDINNGICGLFHTPYLPPPRIALQVETALGTKGPARMGTQRDGTKVYIRPVF